MSSISRVYAVSMRIMFYITCSEPFSLLLKLKNCGINTSPRIAVENGRCRTAPRSADYAVLAALRDGAAPGRRVSPGSPFSPFRLWLRNAQRTAVYSENYMRASVCSCRQQF
jgi:hypothetical protein